MHINRFNESLSAFDVASYLVIGYSLAKLLSGVLSKISKATTELKVLGILRKLKDIPKLPVTEYPDRYFIQVSDGEDIRILKDQKILIMSLPHNNELKLQLSDDEYGMFLRILNLNRS